MKAASLAVHAHQEREARAQGLAFLAGVLVTFLVLAGVLLAAKAGGQAIGWGFQLQSPTVVGGLALVMLLVALNMSGVFEATLPAQGAGGALAAKGGLVGAFFTGMLAVVVAAPCTAPFMATALGFALTQSAPAALLVFAGLGLGFAAPFVAVTFIPALMRLFPKPGAWMDTLKHLLAFPMYGTAAWLLWVFTLQTGSGALALMLAAAVLVGFCAWLVGGVYLKADWTNHDGEIAKLLAEHGRAGVPLYLVYGANGADPAVLPQLLTPGAVAQAIRAAGRKA